MVKFVGLILIKKLNFIYYRVYTLKYFEIILLHCYIIYYTKYLIWCYGYNLHIIISPISHCTGQPKCPIGNGSNSNYHKRSTSNTILTKKVINFQKNNA